MNGEIQPLPRWTILPGDPPALRRELIHRQAATPPVEDPAEPELDRPEA